MFALNYTHTVGWIFIKQQQSPGKYVSQLRHIIMILSQSVFNLTSFKNALTGEAAYTNYIVFWFDPTLS